MILRNRWLKMMNGKEIFNIFGFKVKEEPLSIYPYSPVYRVK